jgi:RHS repeat-associated protein
MDMTYSFGLSSANNGNVLSVTNNNNTARSQSFTYDELNRVVTAQTQATSGTYSWGLSFTYDPWANLLGASVTQGSAPMLSVAVNGKNQITNTGFAYDSAGNTTADGTNSYTFNTEGELKTAAGVTYTYDGDGRRVQKSNGKIYWYGIGSDPLDETDSAGNTNNSSFKEYIFMGGSRIARRDSSNSVNYYFSDQIGSAHIVTNSSGTTLDDSDFYPFGGERSYTSSSGNNYKFTGKERDSESGLDDFAARFYASSYGRFISADDSKYMHPADPQTFNLYSYVANNPINAVDPTGHDMRGKGELQPMQHIGDVEIFGLTADVESGETNSGLDKKTYDAVINGVDYVVQATNAQDAKAAILAAAAAIDANSAEGEQGVSGTPFNLTLGDKSVSGTYAAAQESSSGRRGMLIEASSQDCKGCNWAQTVSRTGNPAVSAHADRDAPDQPLYPISPGPGGANYFHDLPLNHVGGHGSFRAVTSIGVADFNKNTFKVLGSMTWGYDLKQNGDVTVHAPRVSTGAEQRGSIAILRRDSPSWKIIGP